MMSTRRISNLFSLLTLALGVDLLGTSYWCHGQEPSRSYSDLLQSAVKKAGSVRAGFRLVTWDDKETPGPEFTPVKGLDTPNAVPFLIDILKNGPSWTDEKFLKAREGMYFHIARCYAALCLGTTGDRRAFNPLIEILQKGGDLGDKSGVTSKEKDQYPMSGYAALGLGYLRDPNAVQPLIAALQTQGREYAVHALARLGDLRAIRPVIDYASTRGRFDRTIHRCLEYLSGVRFRINYSSESRTYEAMDFPELGKLKSDQLYKKIWQHWLNDGDAFANRQFDEYYTKWKRLRQERPDDQNSKNHVMDEMSRGGIACLPYAIKQVDQGDESLIPMVSRLVSRGGRGLSGKVGRSPLKENATRSECLQWWRESESKWRLFRTDGIEGNSIKGN